MAADNSLPPIGYEQSLASGQKPKVVTIEIRLASKDDDHAEAAMLNMLDWIKENYPADFNLDTWQVVAISDDFSDLAKAYNLMSVGWYDDDDLPPAAIRPRLIGEPTETPNG